MEGLGPRVLPGRHKRGLTRADCCAQGQIARLAGPGQAGDLFIALDREVLAAKTQISVKQKRHGEHASITVTIAEGFRSASYDLSIFVWRDVRHS